MSSKPAIVVDIDDVLHPYNFPLFSEYVEKILGFPYPYEAMTIMYLSRQMPELVSVELEHEIVHMVYNDPRFWAQAPIAGSQDALLTLAQVTAIYAVTARPSAIADPTASYLEEHFPGVFREVIHIGLQGSKECQDTKLQHALRLGAVAMIDDTRHHLDGCADHAITGILFDHPWNRSFEDHPDFVRVFGWSEIPDLITMALEQAA